MAEFQLDTSGAVIREPQPQGGPLYWHWFDLSPFAQGYVEAALRSLRDGDLGYLPWSTIKKDCGFANLAPETLAAMLKDCEATPLSRPYAHARTAHQIADARGAGARFWELRQRGEFPKTFPPRALYLGNDGKVYQREAGR